MKALSPEQVRTLTLAQSHLFDAQNKLAYAVQLFGSLGFELINPEGRPIAGDLSDLCLTASQTMELLAGMTGATCDLLVSVAPAETPQDYGADLSDRELCPNCEQWFLPHIVGQYLCDRCLLIVGVTRVQAEKGAPSNDGRLQCYSCAHVPDETGAHADGDTCPVCGRGELTPDGIPF